MGIYNSSIYRVRPLMDYLRTDYEALKKVLKLVEIDGIEIPEKFWYDGTDCHEKQLKPSKAHLVKLIEYISKKDFENRYIKNKKRRQLCISDNEKHSTRKQACDEAIIELNKIYDHMESSCKSWFIFEGFTNPDILVEGNDYVILCEGKWTESHITTQTTNLRAKDGEYRNQMVRHIQGALNYTDKKIYAFYIADENCGYLDQLTKESFCEQLLMETIPLETIEKEKIKDAFKGYTTWQAIGDVLPNIKFKTKDEIRGII